MSLYYVDPAKMMRAQYVEIGRMPLSMRMFGG